MHPYPVTPDGRYFVVRGRLWRQSTPALGDAERAKLVSKLMRARRDVKRAQRTRDAALGRRARRRVNEAKVALGERGPVWWHDEAPDYNRHLAVNTPYRDWFLSLRGHEGIVTGSAAEFRGRHSP
jgi:hypothetical protein